MPVDVIKTIGSTGDYSTIALWVADGVSLHANLVSDDIRWIGECQNQTFTAGAVITGFTTDATRYVILRCVAGASFKDQAGVRTTPLRYNAANGAAVEGTTPTPWIIDASSNFTQVNGLQIKRDTYNAGLQLGTNCSATQCIIKGSAPQYLNVVRLLGTGSKLVNCLVEVPSTGTTAVRSLGAVVACTIVYTGASPSGTGYSSGYSLGSMIDCAVFNFSTLFTGTLEASTDYNATDDATGFGVGSHNLTSLVFANQFEGSTNDFRAKSTGALHAGTPNADATVDISGTVRSLTTPWIGAWEVTGGAPTSPTSSVSARPSSPSPSTSIRPPSASPSARPSVAPSASPSHSSVSVTPLPPTGVGTILRSTIIIGAV